MALRARKGPWGISPDQGLENVDLGRAILVDEFEPQLSMVSFPGRGGFDRGGPRSKIRKIWPGGPKRFDFSLLGESSFVLVPQIPSVSSPPGRTQSHDMVVARIPGLSKTLCCARPVTVSQFDMWVDFPSV